MSDQTRLVVEFFGPAGSGKTTLMRAVRRRLRQAGFRAPMNLPPLPGSFSRRAFNLQVGLRLCSRPDLLVTAVRLARVLRPGSAKALRKLMLDFLWQSGVITELSSRRGVHVLDHGMLQSFKQFHRVAGHKHPPYYPPSLVRRIPTGDVIIGLEVSRGAEFMRRVERDKRYPSKPALTGKRRAKRIRNRAAKLFAEGYEPELVARVMRRFNSRACVPPLSEAEVLALLDEGRAAAEADPARYAPKPRPADALIHTVFAEQRGLQIITLPNNSRDDLNVAVERIMAEIHTRIAGQTAARYV